MIVINPRSHFIFIYHPKVYYGKKYTVYNGRELTNGEVLEYWGKWIILGDRAQLDQMAEKLDPYVEEEKIPCVKYDRSPSVNLGVAECVMMVYCDRRQRDYIWRILQNFGVKMKAWVSERETMEMWMPGQQLLERWLQSNSHLDEETIQKIREDAGSRLSYVFDHPEEVFTPWGQ